MAQSEKISLFNPFAITTFIISCAAWIIAIACSIAASRELDYFPKFTWWGIAFQILLLIVVAIIYTTNTFHCYRFFISACLAIAFVYNTNSTNNLIYQDKASARAACVGFILLSIVNLLWLFYFGSEPNSPIISSIDSFGRGGNVLSASKQRNTSSHRRPMGSTHYKDESQSLRQSAPIVLNQSNPFEQQPSQPQPAVSGMTREEYKQATKGNKIINRTTLTVDPEYPIFVKGMYDYDASPDENELSFKKGEIFRVKDTKGNWWQAKNSLGEVGMCPSNYLDVIN